MRFKTVVTISLVVLLVSWVFILLNSPYHPAFIEVSVQFFLLSVFGTITMLVSLLLIRHLASRVASLEEEVNRVAMSFIKSRESKES